MRRRVFPPTMAIVLVSAAFLPLSPIWADLRFELSLRVISPTCPDTVTIHSEKDPHPQTLVRDSSDPSHYIGEIPMGTGGKNGDSRARLALRYDVAAAWEKENAAEVIYLLIGPGTSRRIECEIFHEPIAADHACLLRMGAFQKDYRSQVKCYFQARVFHRQWRHLIQQPLHEAALRSAKYWFDAAAWLSMHTNSIFLMDPEAREIMLGYENLSKEKQGFRKRYRNIVKAGYVEEMLVQADVAKYGAVRMLASLIKDGRIEDARTLNEGAKASLALETMDTRRSIAKYQGVSLRMLQENADYMTALFPEAPRP